VGRNVSASVNVDVRAGGRIDTERESAGAAARLAVA